MPGSRWPSEGSAEGAARQGSLLARGLRAGALEHQGPEGACSTPTSHPASCLLLLCLSRPRPPLCSQASLGSC